MRSDLRIIEHLLDDLVNMHAVVAFLAQHA
jgi:hypothetical protein